MLALPSAAVLDEVLCSCSTRCFEHGPSSRMGRKFLSVRPLQRRLRSSNVAAMADAPSQSGVPASIATVNSTICPHRPNTDGPLRHRYGLPCSTSNTPESSDWPTTRRHGVQLLLLPVPLNTTGIILNHQAVRLIVKEPANSEIVDDHQHRSVSGTPGRTNNQPKPTSSLRHQQQLDRLVQL